MLDAESIRIRGQAGPLSARLGFTLIEILVALLIIGVLVAFVIPAVLSARRAAARAQCLSNLKQVGIALESYNGLHHRFAPALRYPNGAVLTQLSPFPALLPGLEQQALFDAVNFAFLEGDSPESPTIENRTVRGVRLGVLLCPADGVAERGSNYRFNRGVFNNKAGPPVYDGPFGLGVVPTAAAVSDGLSRTAFVSERISGDFSTNAPAGGRNVKRPLNDLGANTSDEDYARLCLQSRPDAWIWRSGRYWFYSGDLNTLYSHFGSPNDARPSCGWDGLREWVCIGLNPPRSFHGGVGVLFGDGHVETVADGVDGKVWRALGTHAAKD
ncbi:hypothetical protein VT85_01780 [Planctomyces sp. SH-PL62]|nr:hypothetical protein VT85_01780 [Planctomyces sp. SH-PL62]